MKRSFIELRIRFSRKSAEKRENSQFKYFEIESIRGRKNYETKGHQPSRPTDRLDLPGLDVVDIVEVEDGDRLCLLPRHHPLRVHSRLQQIISIKKCANQKLCLHCTTLTTLLIDSELYPRWYYS